MKDNIVKELMKHMKLMEMKAQKMLNNQNMKFQMITLIMRSSTNKNKILTILKNKNLAI